MPRPSYREKRCACAASLLLSDAARYASEYAAGMQAAPPDVRACALFLLLHRATQAAWLHAAIGWASDTKDSPWRFWHWPALAAELGELQRSFELQLAALPKPMACTLSDECAVCLDIEPAGEGIRFPGCGHVFHAGCLLRWFVTQPTCPYCRG